MQALDRIGLPALELGRSGEAELGDPVIVAAGGRKQFLRANVVGKHEFAGYWEYFLKEAIFTAPAHPFWGGAGLIGSDGKLLGIGSLHVEQAMERGQRRDVNMIVPIDLLAPILDDLLRYGRVDRPPRPWLGVFSAESDGGIIVAGVAEARAGRRRRHAPGRYRRRRGGFERGEPRGLLSQGLEPRPGGRRNPYRSPARRTQRSAAHPVGGSQRLFEETATALKTAQGTRSRSGDGRI